MPQFRHGRFREVRQSRSTCEAGEQNRTANGADDQELVTLVPDTFCPRKNISETQKLILRLKTMSL